MKKILFLLFFLPVILRASALPLEFFSFQLAGFYSTNGETNASGHIAWTPIVKLGLFSIRGELGTTYINKNFVINYQGFLSVPLLPLFGLEIGGGKEKWPNSNEWLLTANLYFPLPAGPIDRIFGSYSRYFYGSGIHEFRVGIGLIL